MVARTASVTVKLLDQLSAPAQIVRNALRGIRGDMQALSGARLGITKQIQDASARARELRSTLLNIGIAGGATALALKRVMKPGTDFETTMVDIRQKADLSAEATKRLGDRIKALAPTVNKSAGEVAKGVDSLMSAGMDPETAFGIMPAIGKTATAYRAEVADIAAASFSVIDNMKVPADRLKRALDIMAQAGKDGRFELKAMAAEFPSLTAAAAALGMKGVKGVAKLSAALQVARKGAGSDSEAATNVKNLMQKLQAEDAVKKWKKFNIDIRKEVKKTQDAGGDVFEMVAELTKKTLKGDIAKLGDLYQDAQVQDFLRPLIEHLEFYKKTRDTAESAANVVEADYKIRMETFQSVIDRTSQAFEKLAVSVGESLIPNLSRLADILTPAVSALADWTSANQTLAGNLISAAGAALALAIAFKAVKLAIGAAKLLSLISGGKLLDYLAPRGTPKAPVTASSIVPKPAVPIAPKAGAGLTPGASVPKTASPGSASTATTPRVMTPAEIASAAKGSAALSGSAGLSKVANGLKGGIIGGVVQYAGEALIDKLFDALPKPNMPAGYDPKVEMNKSAWQRAKEIWARATAEADQADKRPMPRPLDPADFERSRRAQDERRRDPEAARGRAMMGRDVMPDGAAAGVEAGAELGDGIKQGLSGKQAEILGQVDSIIAAARSKLASAGLQLNITPSLTGGGAALRGIHADAGVSP